MGSPSQNEMIDYLWMNIRQGDERAFDSLFKDLFPPLCSFAYKLLANDSEAEETVQEIFLNLWQNKNKIDLKSSLKSYLYQSVHNLAINKLYHYKTQKFQPNRVANEEQWNQINDSFVADDQFIQHIEALETEKILLKAIENLPEKCREIFLLSRVENLSYEEISEKLQISRNTVRVQIFRAIDYLRKFIEKNNL